MEKKKLSQSPEFWLVLGIIAATAVIDVLVWTRKIVVHAVVLGPLFIHHWFSITGVTFVAVFTPLYYLLKRRYPKSYRILSKVHVFGNLGAFTLITVHFSHHMGRPEETAAEGLTGIALFVLMSALVLTGFLLKFQLLRKYLKLIRFVHVSIITSFYVIIFFHVLRGLGYI